MINVFIKLYTVAKQALQWMGGGVTKFSQRIEDAIIDRILHDAQERIKDQTIKYVRRMVFFVAITISVLLMLYITKKVWEYRKVLKAGREAAHYIKEIV